MTFPKVLADAGRKVALELVSFDGADRIPMRDAVGFYFNVRLSPDGEISRVAVVFSGTVMAVKPEAFGLRALPTRDATFVMFAEAAIGDYLESTGLPEFTPSGASAAKIDCFSPHFQAWRDRPPASDEAIEAYLFAHCENAWRFGHDSWVSGPADLLRLNRKLQSVMRIVRLHAGAAWTVVSENADGVELKATPEFLRGTRPKSSAATPSLPAQPSPTPESSPAQYVYVDEARVADLRRLDAKGFDLTKLIALCEELNQCYRAQCYHAVAALTRAVVDHIPPLLGCKSFAEVVNNYAAPKSFKESVVRLNDAARKIADMHLHVQARDSEVLPTRVQVNFSNELDVLLGEIVRMHQE